ncbi:MAG: PspA/IM30 family protein [Phycisphaeraceae bacterium]
MFKAIGRYFRALGYLVTGRIDAARRAVSANPNVVNATFDQIIESKRKSVQQYKDAIARLIVQHEAKMSKIKTLSDDVNRLEQLKEGAAAKARTVVAEMKANGATIEQIKSGEDYQTCMAAYNDFSTKINEKSDHIAELEADVKEMDQTISGHKIQLQQMLREIENLKEEQATTVAEIITAKEEAELNDMLSGISADRTSKELSDMRQLREEMKAKAKVSKELAGTDTKVQEAEFIEYATKHKANDEFDQLIGLAGEADTTEAATPEERTGESKLPE